MLLTKLACLLPIVLFAPTLAAPENGDMSLIRTYRSQHASGSLFGPNWLSSLDRARLKCGELYKVQPAWASVPRTITYTDAEGTAFVYTYKSHGPRESQNGGAPPVKDADGHTDALVSSQPSYYIYKSRDAATTCKLTYAPGGAVSLKLSRLTYSFSNGNDALFGVRDEAGPLLTYGS